MRSWLLFLALLASVCHVPTVRAQAFVGPNLEWSHWRYPDKFREFTGAVLGTGGYYLIPGLRLGYVFHGGAIAASVDEGMQLERLGQWQYTNVIVEPALAYAFMGERRTSPYVGVLSGWHHYHQSRSVTRPLVGATVGVRHRVAAGHGFIRAEFIYERFTKKDTNHFILPDEIAGLRVGCDLLFSR